MGSDFEIITVDDGASGEERLAPVLGDDMDTASIINYGRTLQEPILRLKLRDKMLCVFDDILDLMQVVHHKALENIDTLMPGYTHLNQGQPITFGHWLLSVFDSLHRGLEQFELAYRHTNANTGGCGSCSGITWKVDRELLSKLLGLERTVESTYECEAAQDHSLSALFALSNIVILLSQCAMNMNIWGWSKPMGNILVSASWGASAKTVANKNGRWQVKLKTPKAGGPFYLTIKTSKDKLTINKVFSGDVWLCAGQSNMEMSLRDVINAKSEIAAANYPEIKLFKTKRNTSVRAQTNCAGHWRKCSSAPARYFSATAYFFGRKLYQELKVPIGLIQSAWGGTGIEAWTPLEAQTQDPGVMKLKASFDSKVPGYNEVSAKKNYTAAKAKWLIKRKKWETNGRKGRPPIHPTMKIHPHKNRNYPGNLYNAMIHPHIPYAIKGIIWYQGERNSKHRQQAIHYQVQLTRLITSWRNKWQQNKYPFYLVQLPNFRKAWTKPVMTDNIWPYTRESILEASKNISNCAMAISIDIGDKANIHPKNKQDVGYRLALNALHCTYRKNDFAWSGPIFKKCTFIADKIIVTFDTGGAALASSDGNELFGFSIAGKSGKTYRAEAKIIAPDTVIVSSKKVFEPEKIWYAWADNPEGANLCNKNKLPASPFRADKNIKTKKYQY